MKKLLFYPFFLAMTILFSACPVGLDYPLGSPGKEPIDPMLIGTWTCSSSDAEVLKVSISKKDDFSYQVEVLERGEMYALETDNLTGWVTELGGKKFFYLKPDNEEKFMHYMLKEISAQRMVSCDVSLLIGGVDAVVSHEALRKEVAESMRKEEFCTETLEWRKAE